MTLMTCVSEDIIFQLFVFFWMFLKGTHGSWSKGRAPYPIPSYSGVCSGPSPHPSSSGDCPRDHFRGSGLPALTPWSRSCAELAAFRPDTCLWVSCDSAGRCSFSKATCAPAVGQGVLEHKDGVRELTARVLTARVGRP